MNTSGDKKFDELLITQCQMHVFKIN